MDTQLSRNERYRQTIFLIAWSLMLVKLYSDYSALRLDLGSGISLISMSFFLIKILWERAYSFKELLIGLTGIICGLIVNSITKDMRFFWCVLVLFSLKKVNIDLVIKVTFIMTIVCMIVIYSSYLMGITEDRVIRLNDGIIRHTFGFGHPNTLQCYVLYLMIMYMYLYYEKIGIIRIILLAAFMYVSYYFTYSRTGMIVGIIALLSFIFIKYVPMKLKKFNNKIIMFTGVSYIVVFTILPIIYNNGNSVMILLNNLFSYRISQASYFYKTYGIHLFGRFLDELVYRSGFIYLDMGYAALLFRYGLIYYLFVAGGLLYLLVQYSKTGNYKKTFIVFAFVLFLGTENVATYVFLNVALLFISEFMFIGKKIKLVKKSAV